VLKLDSLSPGGSGIFSNTEPHGDRHCTAICTHVHVKFPTPNCGLWLKSRMVAHLDVLFIARLTGAVRR
jgi:hypothetical protein